MDTTLDAGLKAGRKALEAAQPAAALESLTPVLNRARDLGAKDAEMLALGLLAPALDQLGRGEEALRAAKKAADIAVALEDEQSQAHFSAMAEQLEKGSLLAARPPGAEGEPLTDAEIEAAFDKAEQALTTGNAVAAVAMLAALADAMRDQARGVDEASACGMLAQALMMAGRGADAAGPAQRGLELARELGDPQAIAHFSGLVDSLAGAEGGDVAERAQAEVRRAQVAAQVAAACDAAGKLLDDENPEEAVKALEAALALTDGASAPHAEATVRGMLAQTYMMSGRREEAEAMASRAMALAKEVGDRSAEDQFRELLKMVQGWSPPAADA